MSCSRGQEEWALSLVGNLADLELGDIFQIVSLSRRSGTLQLTTPTASGEISYKVVASSDLDDWSQLAIRPAGGEWSSSIDTNTSESMGRTVFSDFRTSSDGAQFYRLDVTIP